MELQAIHKQPARTFMPFASVQLAAHAADDDTTRVYNGPFLLFIVILIVFCSGDTLHEFFNGPVFAIKDKITNQDTGYQCTTVRTSEGIGISLPNFTIPANAVLEERANFLPLAVRLPNSKPTTPSLMLKELLKRSPPLNFQEPPETQSQRAEQRPVGFHSLEDDVRRRIWALALPEPRIIALARSPTYSVHSQAPVLALLQTCRESRAVAQEYYSLSFGMVMNSPKVYFDLCNDWIYTRCSGCLGVDCAHKLTLTDNHAIVRRLIFEGPMTVNPFPKILRYYPSVERLILISGKSDAARSQLKKSEISFVSMQFEWDSEGDLMKLARTAWMALSPTGRWPFALKQIWRGTLPDVEDSLKTAGSQKNALWTCCV